MHTNKQPYLVGSWIPGGSASVPTGCPPSSVLWVFQKAVLQMEAIRTRDKAAAKED